MFTFNKLSTCPLHLSIQGIVGTQSSGLWEKCKGTNKNVCTQGISAQFSARVQGCARARILAWALEKSLCSHQCPSRIVLGYRARAPSLNVALFKLTHSRAYSPQITKVKCNNLAREDTYLF